MVEMVGDSPANLHSDVLSVFFEDGETAGWTTQSFSDEDEDNIDLAESKAFWDAQHQLLQEVLERSSSIERRVRMDTEEVMRRMQSLGETCSCSGRSMVELCRNCVLRDVADRLRDKGYNSAVCRSKWRRWQDIPSGEHSFVDVVVETKKSVSPVRVVIELHFRAEFEMARASPEYNSLVALLPELFVGKSEKLRNVIKIMCAAAKKCAKENKTHLGPWRKHKYMQAKWLGPCQRKQAAVPLLPVATTRVPDRQTKTRSSMLTFDLHYTAVEVL